MLIPALIWGYGRSVIQLAQVGVFSGDSSESDRRQAKSGQRGNQESIATAVTTANVSSQKASSQKALPAKALSETALSEKAASPASRSSVPVSNLGQNTAVIQVDSETADYRRATSGSKHSGDSRSELSAKTENQPTSSRSPLNPRSKRATEKKPSIPEKTKDSGADFQVPPSISEPGSDPESYNQVRVRKPSIPSRFDGDDDSFGNRTAGKDREPVSLVGLLGIPTVLFGALFFLMWGIISGKIQRIMF